MYVQGLHAPRQTASDEYRSLANSCGDFKVVSTHRAPGVPVTVANRLAPARCHRDVFRPATLHDVRGEEAGLDVVRRGRGRCGRDCQPSSPRPHDDSPLPHSRLRSDSGVRRGLGQTAARRRAQIHSATEADGGWNPSAHGAGCYRQSRCEGPTSMCVANTKYVITFVRHVAIRSRYAA